MASLPGACTPTATAAGRATGSARTRGLNPAPRNTSAEDYRTKIPIFVSEWGTSSYSGDGGVCACEAKEFLDVFSDKDGSGGVTLSMAQWSWADKSESSAALAPGACRNGGDWDSLSESGEFLRAYVRDAMRA